MPWFWASSCLCSRGAGTLGGRREREGGGRGAHHELRRKLDPPACRLALGKDAEEQVDGRAPGRLGGHRDGGERGGAHHRERDVVEPGDADVVRDLHTPIRETREDAERD